MKKRPDNVVYDESLQEYTPSKKEYPTNVGAPAFEPMKDNKLTAHKADTYFSSRLLELKDEYKELIEEYNWTKLVYEATYSFEPLPGEPYYLYEKEDKSIFLSLIGPTEWEQCYIGTFKLLNSGKWEKV
jgi:hypothetical protein